MRVIPSAGGGGLVNQVIRVEQTYAVTNATEDRTYDANATDINEIADILGTLIADLKLSGIIK